MTAPPPPALCFHRVTARYGPGQPPALDDCTLRVEPGERVALMGANGSGKTSVLLAAVGLIPHEGEIQVGGVRLDPARPEPARSQIGLLFSVPEDQLLFPRVLDDVAFSLRRHGVPVAEAEGRARAALAGLDAAQLAERSPYHMSRGQRLRAALAGTLVTRPPLLLLDEPAGGLDPAGRRLLIRQLNDLASAMLVATHDLDFASRCCHRFLLLEGGRVAAEGTDPAFVRL
jgi:energy-coupling factor transporter ATP-binding protein EcfA2